MSESGAILRYIAMKWNKDLLGKTDADRGVFETVYFLNLEFMEKIMPYLYIEKPNEEDSEHFRKVVSANLKVL
jgi:hypothetical protein